MSLSLQFLGAAETVTGSKFVLSDESTTLLIDCGLFQGIKKWRLQNWEKFPLSMEEIDAVLLTHAHIDHSGYLPRLVKEGFQGPIYATRGTKRLCRILLPDSAKLQEEDTAYANRKGFSKHHPALSLYSEKDAIAAVEKFKTIEFHSEFEIGKFKIEFIYAGHIIGASSIVVRHPEGSFLFSGDLGRAHDFLMKAPERPPSVDYVIMESTYGDRIHPKEDVLEVLEGMLRPTLEKKGVVLIPSFTVGRAQALMFCLHELISANKLPKVPIFLNSPMAIDATESYIENADQLQLSKDQCKTMCRVAQFVNSPKQSEELNHRDGPMIIISASGMLSGGRILHHLKAFGSSPKNLILLAGFQAPGTRGATLLAGQRTQKIHGGWYSIQAQVLQMEHLSAHADQEELIQWVSSFPTPPKKVFLVHGEAQAQDSLRLRLETDCKLNVKIPSFHERITFA